MTELEPEPATDDRPRYDLAALVAFARALFEGVGLDPDHARAVATHLAGADAMGHDTHGLGLAPWYLREAREGILTARGEPGVLSDRGAAVAWRGRRLAGAWLVERALDLACDRAADHGTCTVAVGDAHHIGALAAYLTRATDRGMMVSLASSSPSGAHVAPFGGTTGVLTPDPAAHGIPTGGEPILIDISASITTYNMAQRLIREGRRYPHPWVMDAQGEATDDPAALGEGGTLLPTGGLDHGQKGYGMALQVEALTQGLAGFGRADPATGTHCAFTVQVWDPGAFGGREAFLRQTRWLAEACLAAPPRPGGPPVRLPGQAGLARRRRALAEGVPLYPTVMPGLLRWAEALGVAAPPPLEAAKGRPSAP